MMSLYAENDGAICGNGVVEDIEDCDCGRYPNGTRVMSDPCCDCVSCTIPTTNITCSPSQGPCCDTNCQYLDSSTICQVETTCSAESRCKYPS